MQDAIDNANDGDTVFVYNGIYRENIDIDKPLFLTGENNNSTIIYGTGGNNQIVNITSDYVTLNNFLIEHNFSENAEIRYDSLMRITNVKNVSIASNNFLSYYTKEIWYYIDLDNANQCSIRKNNLNGSFSDKRGYNYCGIGLSGSDNNIISDNIIRYHWDSGIILYESAGNVILNNLIKYSNWGLCLDYSNNNHIEGNIIIDNDCDGIYLFNSSDNFIQKNEISYNGGTGLRIFEGSKNIITNNNIISNSYLGVDIHSNGFIHNLFISPNLNRTACLYNTISYNNFIENGFINNGKQAYFQSSYFTDWKMNYWGEPRTKPYPILGKTIIFFLVLGIPLINFDWYPASEPYDIIFSK